MNSRKLVFAALCLVLAAGTILAQIPPAPTNLVAQMTPTPGTTGAVKLTWLHSSTTQMGFRIYRSIHDTSHFVSIGMTGQRQFFDFHVMVGTTYYYYVTALGNTIGQESPPSNIASITVTPPLPPLRGTIRGTVIDDSTLAPIRHAMIRFFRQNITVTNMGPTVYTDSLGRYQALLDTGTYFIRASVMSNTASGPLYRTEWFDNAPDPLTATPVAVAESSLFVADFALTRIPPPTYAFINGRVTDTAGVPLPNASVAVVRTIQEMAYLAAMSGSTPGLGEETTNLDGLGYTRGVVWSGRTDSLGNYHARVITGRSYIAVASKIAYLPEFFNNKTNPTEADIILLAHDTSGVDFSLAPRSLPQNSISGVVRDSFGVGVPSRVVLYPIAAFPTPNITAMRFGHTDSLGVYTINYVPAGKYFVRALPFSNYAPAFYKEGEYGVTHREDADTVLINGNVTGINVGVVMITSPGLVRMNGTVRSSNGQPLNGAVMVAKSPEGAVLGCGFSDGSGVYSIDAIPSGTVTVSVERRGYSSLDRTVLVPTSTYGMTIDYSLSPSSPTSVPPATKPVEFALEQNYPNPFNPSTTIGFSLPTSSMVTLTVYNLLGQEIATILNEEVGSGKHEVVWNGTDNSGRTVASGLYFYRLRATGSGREFSQMRKMVLLK